MYLSYDADSLVFKTHYFIIKGLSVGKPIIHSTQARESYEV